MSADEARMLRLPDVHNRYIPVHRHGSGGVGNCHDRKTGKPKDQRC
jgi:hypothetical protein